MSFSKELTTLSENPKSLMDLEIESKFAVKVLIGVSNSGIVNLESMASAIVTKASFTLSTLLAAASNPPPIFVIPLVASSTIERKSPIAEVISRN